MGIDLEAIFGYPAEVRHLDWRTRERLIDEWQKRMQTRAPAKVWTSLLPVLALNVFIAFGGFIIEPLGAAGGWLFAAGILGGLLSIIVWGFRASHRTDLGALQALMLEQSIRPARCFRCKYDLRVTTTDECPECGERLVSATASDRKA